MKAHRETGIWQRQLFGEELSEAARLAHARVALLSVRVRDEAVRNLVDDINQGTIGLALAPTPADAMAAMVNMMAAFNKAQKRIGELLREIDAAD